MIDKFLFIFVCCLPLLFHTVFGQGQAVLSVIWASSVHNYENYGPEQALTEVSTTNTKFWHSADGDFNPTITFELQKEQEILYVEVVDRQDCCHDRFRKVEVRVGPTPSFKEATTCGIQSFAGETKYKYICNATSGKYVIIQKNDNSEFLHINHVTVVVVPKQTDGDCYKDSHSRLLGELRTVDKTGMTPEVCKAICFEKNKFQYAGVQYKYECFCGNNSPPSSKLLPISQCNLPCSGDSSKKCGGAWKMNVYKKRESPSIHLRFESNIKSITSTIKIGTQVMKMMTEQIMTLNFASLDKINEKNLIKMLRGQISVFSSNFNLVKNKFDQMYEDFKTILMSQKNKIFGLESRIETVNVQIKTNRERVLSAKKAKNSLGYDLKTAKDEKNSAHRNYHVAKNQYNKAKKVKKDYEIGCAVSAPFAWKPIGAGIAAGLCGKYIDTVGDKKAAYYKMKSRLELAQSKVENAVRLEDQYARAKSSLLVVQGNLKDLENSKRNDQTLLKSYNAFQEELGALQIKIQTYKTQVDIIETRFDTVQDSQSSSLATFIDHFAELINFIYKPRGVMRLYGRNSQDEAVKEILRDLDQVIEDLKKKETDSKSSCPHRKDICKLIWSLYN